MITADEIRGTPFADDDGVRVEDRDVLGMNEAEHLAYTADLQSTLRLFRHMHSVALERVVSLTDLSRRQAATIESLRRQLRGQR
jgi:hypothetical protein